MIEGLLEKVLFVCSFVRDAIVMVYVVTCESYLARLLKERFQTHDELTFLHTSDLISKNEWGRSSTKQLSPAAESACTSHNRQSQCKLHSRRIRRGTLDEEIHLIG